MRSELQIAVEDALRYLGEVNEDAYNGETVEKLFRDCEYAGATVYWGFWTRKDLGEIIKVSCPFEGEKEVRKMIKYYMKKEHLIRNIRRLRQLSYLGAIESIRSMPHSYSGRIVTFRRKKNNNLKEVRKK